MVNFIQASYNWPLKLKSTNWLTEVKNQFRMFMKITVINLWLNLTPLYCIIVIEMKFLLILQACVPYFDTLEQWIYKGIINDPYSEVLLNSSLQGRSFLYTNMCRVLEEIHKLYFCVLVRMVHLRNSQFFRISMESKNLLFLVGVFEAMGTCTYLPECPSYVPALAML